MLDFFSPPSFRFGKSVVKKEKDKVDPSFDPVMHAKKEREANLISLCFLGKMKGISDCSFTGRERNASRKNFLPATNYCHAS